MPATYLLATDDPVLFASWSAQLLPGRPVISLGDPLPQRLAPGVPVVVVVDAMVADRVPGSVEKCLTLAVGEPHTVLYEQLRISGRARHSLSYTESRTRLAEFLPLMEELAERTAALELLMEKTRRMDGVRVQPRSAGWADTPEIWDFLEGAVENLGSRERLLGEFRRAARYLLRASHTVFFLRDESGFRADRGSSSCPLNDPLVAYLSSHPVVLDGQDWPGPTDPIAELAVRNRLALWGARLLVPLHDNGHLIGMIACGVRDDGQPYDNNDKMRSVFVARLLRQFLTQSGHIARVSSFYERTRLGERYLPHTLILSADEEPPRHVPLAVRALIGETRRARDTRRIMPTAEQPFRASAGVIIETGGTWAFWEEASGELFDRAQRQRLDRLTLLRDLALTLNHEVGNALVSFAALKHANGGASVPEGLRTTFFNDVAKLELINLDLVHLATFTETEAEAVDMRTILETVGVRCGVRVEVGPDPVVIAIAPRLVEFALEAIVRSVAENRPDLGMKELAIQLRATGAGEELTALISVKGKQLELEGILPENTPDSIPNQGRLRVFIGKEIIRLHGGAIHAGPGMEGTEILISLRKW